ncbi:MAG: tetratricopeptide repeat protein [Endomicrobiales bacterium]
MPGFLHSLLKKGLVFLVGTVACLVLLEAGLQVAGALRGFLQESANRKQLQKKETVRILCLGDSMTFRGYPLFLEGYINECSKDTRFTVIDKSEPGIGAGYIVSRLDSNLDQYKPDIVVVMMGIPFSSDGVLPYKDRAGSTLKLVRVVLTLKEQLFQKRWMRSIDNAAVPYPVMAPLPGAYGNNVRRRESRTDFSRADECYHRKDLHKAESLYREILAQYPDDPFASIKLADFYHKLGKEEEAENVLSGAAELLPRDSEVAKTAGFTYVLDGKYAKAEKQLRIAAGLAPGDGDIHLALAYACFKQGKADEGKKILLQAVPAHGLNDRLLRYLAVVCLSSGDYKGADRYFALAEEISSTHFNPATVNDYQTLAQKVLSRNARLICMQYPARSVKPLKKMLQAYDGIVFIDNEKVFKDALKQGAFDDYFKDHYGGDFGHPKQKAIDLLVENVTRTILRIVD